MPNQNNPNQGSQTTVPPVISPKADIPPLPPDFQNITTPTSVPPPGTASPPNTPPVISQTPKKKFGGGRIIATILGILLLVGGIGAGIYLTQQQQLFQQKAFTEVWGGENICNVIKLTAVENVQCSQLCYWDSDGNEHCSGKNDIGNYYNTTFTLTNTTSQPHTVSYTKFEYYCPRTGYGDDQGHCMQNEVKEDGTITLQGGQSQNFLAEVTGLMVSTKKGTASCGTYQMDFSVHSVDGDTTCSFAGQPSLGVNRLAYGYCETGRSCDADWTPPPQPTPSPTPTPTPTQTPTPTATPPTVTAQCLSVLAYSANTTLQTSPVQWAPLTKEQLAALKPGDSVYFCAAGTTSSGVFDKGQFKINATIDPETTTKRPGSNDFCQSYKILPTDTTIDVKARIHHATLNKWFGETF